jgi:hypothetical protein
MRHAAAYPVCGAYKERNYTKDVGKRNILWAKISGYSIEYCHPNYKGPHFIGDFVERCRFQMLMLRMPAMLKHYQKGTQHKESP